MQTVTELLSEGKRKVMYIAYGLIGVGLGATQTAFTAAEVASPMWLVVAFSVYLYIGGAFGLVAAQNVGAQEVIVSPYNTDEVLEDYDELTENYGKHGVVEGEEDQAYDTEPEIVRLDVDINN